MLALWFSLLPVGAGPQGATEGSGVRQLVLVVLFLAASLVIVRFPDRWRLVREGIPASFALLLLYVALSAVWSPDPWVSVKRVVQIIGVTVLAAAVLVGGNGHNRLHRLVPPVLWVGMAMALAFTALFSKYAFSELGYRAFMATKNNFGQFAVLCALIPLVLLALEPTAKRWLWLPLVALGFVGLVISRSATSAVALASVGVMYAVALLFRKLHWSWIAVLLVLAMAALTTAFAVGVAQGFPSSDRLLSALLSPTGRDVSLSGRTYLWELMVQEAMRHPWFGTGYGGFWLGLEGQSGQIAYQVRWGYPGQAHNGYLDLFNELGLVGCLIVFIFILQHSGNILKLLRKDRTLGNFHLALFVLLLVLNIAEATFLRTTHLWWLVFVASVVEVSSQTYQPTETFRHRQSTTGERSFA